MLHARDIQAVEIMLDGLYGEVEHDDEEINVRLAMLAHGDDPMDVARADELLNGPADVYTAYLSCLLHENRSAAYVFAPDQQSATVEAEGETYTVRPLTGRQWRLAMSRANRFDRIAAMTGMTREKVLALPLGIFNGLEDAARPFVLRVWTSLNIGQHSSGGSSGEESA